MFMLFSLTAELHFVFKVNNMFVSSGHQYISGIQVIRVHICGLLEAWQPQELHVKK